MNNGSDNRQYVLPTIPEFITVHLGPADSDAANVTVSFDDYIKNVASNEIYPTWPDEAIQANVLAQISFALNRIYTEYYRSRGYDFDITSNTGMDQSYVPSSVIFENVSEIVDKVFTTYIRREGSVEPIFAQYCDGIQTQCGGLSQWGTVDRAMEGLSPLDILKYYYGDTIELVENVPVNSIESSAPATPLKFGSVGNDVRTLQVRLNRISTNYPSIPKIAKPDGIFDNSTEDAVKEFQRIFGLTVDGIVGNATWFKVASIYGAVKKLNELLSEGLQYDEVALQFPETLTIGSTGVAVSVIQYFINFIAQYIEGVEAFPIDGIYGENTARSVREFQEKYGLPVTGEMDEATYNALYDEYRAILDSLPDTLGNGLAELYPGYPLRIGFEGDDVSTLQNYLNVIGQVYTEIPPLQEDGIFGPQTEAAVIAFQNLFELTPDGDVDAITWVKLGEIYTELIQGSERMPGQYPGYPLGEEEGTV